MSSSETGDAVENTESAERPYLTGGCPTDAVQLMDGIATWMKTMSKWAEEVKVCLQNSGNKPPKAEVLLACATWRPWSQAETLWAQQIENNWYLPRCGKPMGHTKPPEPPF